MKKYSVEFLGTFLFILSIIGILGGASSTVPLYIGTALATLVYMGGLFREHITILQGRLVFGLIKR